MRKLLFALIFLGLFFLSATFAKAALVTVDEKGEVVWKVLSYQDQLALSVPEKGEMEIKKIAAKASSNNSITLKKEDGKVLLGVGENGEKLDVTDWNDDLVEIEERGDVKKIKISLQDNKFAIEQDGAVALTEFPINVDPKENELSLVTDSGSIFLSVLPREAAETALRSRFINRLVQEKMEVSQRELGVLSYMVNGEKVINIFNITDYAIPVKAYVSTSTGEILFVDQPTWLKLFGFFL